MINDIEAVLGTLSEAFSGNATLSLLVSVFGATLVLFFYMHRDICKTDSETGERGFWLTVLHENRVKLKYNILLKNVLQKLGSALTRYELSTLVAPRLQRSEIRYIRKRNGSALSLGLFSFCLHAMVLFTLILGLAQWLPEGGKFEIGRVTFRPPSFGALEKLQSVGLIFLLILISRSILRLTDFLLVRIWQDRSALRFFAHRALYAIFFGIAFATLIYIFPRTLGLVIALLLSLALSGIFSGVFLVTLTGFYAFSFIYLSEWLRFSFGFPENWVLVSLGSFWIAFSLSTVLEWIRAHVLLAHRAPALASAITIFVLYSLCILWAFTPANVGSQYLTMIVLYVIFFFGGTSLFISSVATRYFLGRGLVRQPLKWASIDVVAGMCSLFLFGFFISFTLLVNGKLGGGLDWVLRSLFSGPGFKSSILNEPYSFVWFYATTLVALFPTVLHFTIFSVSVSIAPARPWRSVVSGLLMRGGMHRDCTSGKFVSGFPGQGRLGLFLLSATIAIGVTGSVAFVILLWSITSNFHAGLGGFLFNGFRGLAFAMGMKIHPVFLD